MEKIVDSWSIPTKTTNLESVQPQPNIKLNTDFVICNSMQLTAIVPAN